MQYAYAIALVMVDGRSPLSHQGHDVLYNLINHLRKLVMDTQIIMGSEAYAAARLAYSSAKTSGKGQGVDDTLYDLSRHFHRIRRNGNGNGPSNKDEKPSTAK